MNIRAFSETLPIMGLGLLGIFAVMAVIYAIILLLGRATRSSKEN